MGTKAVRNAGKNKSSDISIDNIIERLRKMRALNCSPSDVGLDGYLWKKFITTTQSHLVTRMF